MQDYIGYIRVSTVRQGTQGVSLQEQKDAILRYAERNRFTISYWLEEMVTAGKQGRPEFNRALKLLRSGQAKGIILHKLDRGARNLRDWATIGELSDQGVEVHFVNESLDLQSRGGRLSADIQAVVAADFIRNQREETRKGMYGRLKQGLYPWAAPIGYLDNGKGKPKTICPKMGPLVRKAFELYVTARYNYETLEAEVHRLGLRNRKGGRVTANGLTSLLNNPFYMGVIHLDRTDEDFLGIHQPLIGRTLFERVQQVLHGKVNTRTRRHEFQFRRMLKCRTCQYSLIGELQRGHIYYRCHSKVCRGTSVREDTAVAAVEQYLRALQFDDEEKACFRGVMAKETEQWATRQEEDERSAKLRLAQIKDRLNRLTDAYLDAVLDKATYEERKLALQLELREAEAVMRDPAHYSKSFTRAQKYLEQAAEAWLSHQKAFPEEKREMVRSLTSNIWVEGKDVAVEPSLPFGIIANRSKTTMGDPHRDVGRRCLLTIESLTKIAEKGELPDLPNLSAYLESG